MLKYSLILGFVEFLVLYSFFLFQGIIGRVLLNGAEVTNWAMKGFDFRDVIPALSRYAFEISIVNINHFTHIMTPLWH